MSELVQAAKLLANSSHQRITANRSAAQQNFESHLKSVAQIVASVADDEHTIAAAWLHDVVEETSVTLDDVRRRFGEEVSRIVGELTPVSRPGDGDLSERFKLDKQHLAQASAAAKTVKLADLIDTCGDLYKTRSGSFAEYAREAAELVEVLQDGNPRLAQRLRRNLKEFSDAGVPAELHASKPLQPIALPLSTLRVFRSAFSAQDIAEPLVTPAQTFSPSQVVAEEDSLTDVIETLTRHDLCYVSADGTVNGVISRTDIQKPAVRMWLFGIITVAEIEITERVRQQWPNDTWVSMISPPRMAKAKQLQQERERRREGCLLLDCLQLGDKLEILTSDAAQLAALDIPTPSAARRVSKQIQGLRNTLAHSQDFVDEDWPQIVRLARRIENLVRQF